MTEEDLDRPVTLRELRKVVQEIYDMIGERETEAEAQHQAFVKFVRARQAEKKKR